MLSPTLSLCDIPLGSSLYYALLFCSPVQRKGIRVIFSFEQHLKTILIKTELQIAKNKLSWWAKEISQLYLDKPQHPLSQLLIPFIEKYDLPECWFQNIIQATIYHLEKSHFSELDLLNYCELVTGKFLLFGKIFADKSPFSLEFIRSISFSIQFVNMIRYFGKNSRKGLFYFTQEAIPEYAQHAKIYYTKALSYLLPSERISHNGLLILGNIYVALLNEIERENFKVNFEKISLTPLRKFWIAWRSFA